MLASLRLTTKNVLILLIIERLTILTGKNFRSNSMNEFVKIEPWLLLIDLFDMLKIWGLFSH